jgi:hypothetical protein
MNGNSEGEYNINIERMEKLVNISNNTPYNATDKTSNKMNDTDIDNLIKKKEDEIDMKKALFSLDTRRKIRLIMVYILFKKRRYNLACEYQKVDSNQGNSYLLRYRNDVKTNPRWKLNR